MVHLWCCSLPSEWISLDIHLETNYIMIQNTKKKKPHSVELEEFGDRKMAVGSVGKELVC